MVCCDYCKLRGVYKSAVLMAYWTEEGPDCTRAHVPCICEDCKPLVPHDARQTELPVKYEGKVIEMWPRVLKSRRAAARR